MNFDLQQLAREKLILVAHRGAWGGNIPCNTVAAYEIALQQGADMIEIDVVKSADGRLFVFHPTMEPAHLGRRLSLERLTAAEIRRLRYVNIDNTATQFGIDTLDDVLEQFKGRCFINVDKFRQNPREISDAIRAHGMAGQILVKTAPKPEYLDLIEQYCPDIPYMAMIRDPAEIDAVCARRLCYVGNEVLFSDEASPFAAKDFIAAQHRQGRLVWCNAIVYDYRTVLSAGHNDDTSLLRSAQDGWGWIAARGYDFMQTDWVKMAHDYLQKTGALYRRPGNPAAAPQNGAR